MASNKKSIISKKMTAYRLPEITRKQIEYLATKYGTKTNVIIMAVRDLYLKEVEEGQAR